MRFELALVNGIKSVSRLHFFACGCPGLPASFLKKLYLLHCIAFAFLSNLSCLYLCGVFFCGGVFFSRFTVS